MNTALPQSSVPGMHRTVAGGLPTSPSRRRSWPTIIAGRLKRTSRALSSVITSSSRVTPVRPTAGLTHRRHHTRKRARRDLAELALRLRRVRDKPEPVNLSVASTRSTPGPPLIRDACRTGQGAAGAATPGRQVDHRVGACGFPCAVPARMFATSTGLADANQAVSAAAQPRRGLAVGQTRPLWLPEASTLESRPLIRHFADATTSRRACKTVWVHAEQCRGTAMRPVQQGSPREPGQLRDLRADALRVLPLRVRARPLRP
jgi:hypothetical protein